MDQIAKASSWKLVECDRQPPHCWLLNRQLVVSAPHVLHQRMPRRDYKAPFPYMESSTLGSAAGAGGCCVPDQEQRPGLSG
jgi:hypothetical protein